MGFFNQNNNRNNNNNSSHKQQATSPLQKRTTNSSKTTSSSSNSSNSYENNSRGFLGPSSSSSSSSPSSSSLATTINHNKYNYRPEEKIHLNVGGNTFITTAYTLTRLSNTKLADIGRKDKTFFRKASPQIQKDSTHSSHFFIDRDPTHFNLILNFLRDGDIDLPEDKTIAKRLLREAIFYEIQPLIKLIKKHLNVSDSNDNSSINKPMSGIFDSVSERFLSSNHNTTKDEESTEIHSEPLNDPKDLVFLPNHERILSFNDCSSWETVLSKQILTAIDPSENTGNEMNEYRIRMRIDALEKGNNSFGLIVGLAAPDHSKEKQIGKGGIGYGYIALKGERFDGHKDTYGSTFGRGDEIAIILNRRDKTISFELNFENQGVAFTNVEMPLCVAISAWCTHAQIRLLE